MLAVCVIRFVHKLRIVKLNKSVQDNFLNVKKKQQQQQHDENEKKTTEHTAYITTRRRPFSTHTLWMRTVRIDFENELNFINKSVWVMTFRNHVKLMLASMHISCVFICPCLMYHACALFYFDIKVNSNNNKKTHTHDPLCRRANLE